VPAIPSESGSDLEAAAGVHGHVLIVDDEALIRWSVAETLAARGMRVSQAADGAAAMRLIEREIFDVVVLDLRLPDVNDLSLLAKVRERSPHSRVVVMTAFGTPDVVAQALGLGASRVVGKPFEMEELGAVVAAAVAADGR
jgi:DNA-binding NtrC family response regulator